MIGEIDPTIINITVFVLAIFAVFAWAAARVRRGNAAVPGFASLPDWR